MTDIVERLRGLYDKWNSPHSSPDGLPTGASVMLDAADEIKRLRAALGLIESVSVHSGGDIHGVSPIQWKHAFDDVQAIARAAIGGDK